MWSGSGSPGGEEKSLRVLQDASQRCSVVQIGVTMKEQATTPQVEQTSHKPRVSVTFPADHYAAIERIARQKRVSIAWVVRDAVERYLEPEPILFNQETP